VISRDYFKILIHWGTIVTTRYNSVDQNDYYPNQILYPFVNVYGFCISFVGVNLPVLKRMTLDVHRYGKVIRARGGLIAFKKIIKFVAKAFWRKTIYDLFDYARFNGYDILNKTMHKW